MSNEKNIHKIPNEFKKKLNDTETVLFNICRHCVYMFAKFQSKLNSSVFVSCV